MADNVEVKLGADTSDATSSMKEAATSIAANLASMKDALEKFTAASERTHNAVHKHTEGMKGFFSSFSENVRVKFGSINSAFETFNTRLALLGEIFAGGLLGRAAIKSLTEMAETVRGLQITLGLGSEAATKFAVNLKLAGIEAGTFEQMAFRIGMRIKANAGDFAKLGVTIRNTSTGDLLPMDQILQNVYKRMLDFKPGSDQMQFALATVGRNAKDFAIDMEMLNATNQRAGQLMEQLGIEMGGARQGQVRAYQIEFRAFQVVLGEVASTLGAAMLPRLERLAEWLISVGPTAIRNVGVAFGILADVMNIVVTIAKTLVANFVALGEASQSALKKIMQWIDAVPGMRAFGDETKKVLDVLQKIDRLPTLTGLVSVLLGTAKTNKAAADTIVSDTKDMFRRLEALLSDYSQYENDAWSKIEKARAGASMGIPSSGKNLSMPDLGKGGATQMEIWKQQLEEIKMAQGYFREYDKAEEAAFWENKLALVKKGSKEYIEIYSLMYQARKAYAHEELADALATFQREIDAAKDNQAQQMALAKARTATVGEIFHYQGREYEAELDKELKLAEEWKRKEEAIMRVRTKMVEDAAAHEVAMEEENLKQQVALRNISADQKFAIEQALENKLYALKLKALEDEKATLTAGTLAYEQVAAKIEALEQAHQLKLTTIANQAELDRKQAALTAAADIQSAFATFFADLANGTKSVTQAFKDMVKTITADLNKLASEQIAKQLFGPGTSGGGFLNQLTGGIFGGGAAGGAGKGADAAAETAHTTAVTADTAATTTQTTTSTLLNTVATTLQAGFTALVAAANSAAAALTAVGASGGGGGIGSLFGGGSSFGDMFGGFMQSGTPYVPRDMLAFIHKGEAVIPAALNTGTGVGAKNWSMNVHYHLAGPLDRPTQDQAAAHMARVLNRTMQKNM